VSEQAVPITKVKETDMPNPTSLYHVAAALTAQPQWSPTPTQLLFLLCIVALAMGATITAGPFVIAGPKRRRKRRSPARRR
jgi:hypothetical protein